MSFAWSDYLVLARKLAEASDEASQRTAISRAYYALYIVARRRLEANGVVLSGEQHRAVWSAYGSRSNPNQSPDFCGRIAVRANQLRVRRQIADYEDAYPGLDKAVREQISIASQLLEQIQQLPNEKLPTSADVERAAGRR